MTDKLLLDVDGVINIYPSANIDQYETPSRYFEANGYLINWNPAIMERLLSFDLEVNWLTTWQDDANKFIGPEVGIPESHVLSHLTRQEMFDYLRGGNGWWKLPFAKDAYADAIENDHRIVWIDDDIDISAQAREFIDETDPNTLLAISPVYGITVEHLDKIGEFLNG